MNVDRKILLEALRLYREANHGGPLDNERMRRKIDEQIQILKEPITAQMLRERGGDWLSELREHVQWNTDSTLNSNIEEVTFLRPMSMRDMEALGASVAAAALKEFIR